MRTITTLFDMHTRLYRNVLAGIEAEDASVQRHPDTNHIQFLAGHLVFTRLMLKDFGGLQADPRFNAFEKLIDPQVDYLPLPEIIAKWDAIATPLSEGLKALPDGFTDTDAPFPTPAGKTMGDFLAFLMHHEAYHIGQLGLLRRYADKAGMRYN